MLTAKEFQELRSGEGGSDTSMGGVLIFRNQDGVHIAYKNSEGVFLNIVINKREEFRNALEEALKNEAQHFIYLAGPIEEQMFDSRIA